MMTTLGKRGGTSMSMLVKFANNSYRSNTGLGMALDLTNDNAMKYALPTSIGFLIGKRIVKTLIMSSKFLFMNESFVQHIPVVCSHSNLPYILINILTEMK